MSFFLTKKVNNTTGTDCGITHLVIFLMSYIISRQIFMEGFIYETFASINYQEADLLKFPEGCDLGNKVASKAGRKVGGKLRNSIRLLVKI